MMFNCVEGALPPGIKDMFEVHIRECGSCARLLKGIQRLEETIMAEKAMEPGPFVATRILQHLENNRERNFNIASMIFKTIPVGVVIFLAVALGYFIGSLGISRNLPAGVENPPTEVIRTDLFINDFVDEDLNL